MLRTALAVTLLACFSPMLPTARADVASVYFGRGVQAFQDGDWRRAEAYFDRAVTYGPGEPRHYYYRGVAKQRLGEPHAAESDYYQGVAVESSLGRPYQLGSALWSLSGEDRGRLDQLRVELLSGLPAYRGGAGLPGGARRNAQALRPEFRLPLESLLTVDSAEQLAVMVESQRPSNFPTVGAPGQVVVLAPPPGAGGAGASEPADASAGEEDPFGGAAAADPAGDGGDPFLDDPEPADDADPFGDDPDPFADEEEDPFG